MHNLTHFTIWAVILGMAVTNFILRFVPMAALSRIKMPAPIMRWLSYIPISVMGALFAKEVLLPSTQYDPFIANPGIYGAIIAMITFKMSKSFMGATLAGMVSYVALRALFTTLGFGV